MMVRFSRYAVLAGVLAGLLVGASACGAPMLDDADLTATLRTQLDAQGVHADDLACPDLPAEVGSSVRCTFTVGGQPVDAVATVAQVDGARVTYDVHTEARPVSHDVLARSIGQQRPGRPAGDIRCSGDLPAQVGSAVTCTLTGAGGATDWTVRTTSVDGGRIDYSIEQGRT